MNETDKKIAEAELGEEARKFIESNIGAALIGKALELRAIALEGLESVNPTDVPKIEELQRKAQLPRHFEQWLIELMQEGDTAFAVLQQQRESHG